MVEGPKLGKPKNHSGLGDQYAENLWHIGSQIRGHFSKEMLCLPVQSSIRRNATVSHRVQSGAPV
ncbi:hypothetical protein HYT04_02480 [Candidatus Kaiserbacteria bacterium]|nr:hypothetical protein [Candidatus Kaiserbacteria bacterium]